MSEIVKDIIDNGAIFVIDPTVYQTDPDEFLDKYGHLLDTIGLVAKGKSGFAFYQSNNAPKHQSRSVFFHSFCTIADNMGIKVDAFNSVHGDDFLSQNADFRVYTSDGNPVSLYSCPSQPYLSQYGAAISLEIAQYPIETLVLDDLMFANLKTCFCERCRRTFSQKWNIERDFSFEYLKSRDYYNNWVEYRANLISQTLRDITDGVKAQKNIDVGLIFKVDKETNFLDGTTDYYGQDLSNIMKITNNLIIHVNPWSQLPSSTNDSEYQAILAALSSLNDLSTSDINYSLYFWNVNKKEVLDTALQLKTAVRAEHIYIENGLPVDYTKRRAVNLGF